MVEMGVQEDMENAEEMLANFIMPQMEVLVVKKKIIVFY
jgi:hypothetical protein